MMVTYTTFVNEMDHLGEDQTNRAKIGNVDHLRLRPDVEVRSGLMDRTPETSVKAHIQDVAQMRPRVLDRDPGVRRRRALLSGTWPTDRGGMGRIRAGQSRTGQTGSSQVRAE